MSSYTVSPEFAPQEPLALQRAEQAFFVEIGFEAVFYGMPFTTLPPKSDEPMHVLSL